MAITKAEAVGIMPFAAPVSAVPPPASVGTVKSLTVKLEASDYADLRAYCYQQEQITGTRLTHQAVVVKALKAFLANAR